MACTGWHTNIYCNPRLIVLATTYCRRFKSERTSIIDSSMIKRRRRRNTFNRNISHQLLVHFRFLRLALDTTSQNKFHGIFTPRNEKSLSNACQCFHGSTMQNSLVMRSYDLNRGLHVEHLFCPCFFFWNIQFRQNHWILFAIRQQRMSHSPINSKDPMRILLDVQVLKSPLFDW